jgi:hypothetical protein
LVSTKGANSWTNGEGNVLLDTPTGKLYACGTSMKIYAVAEQKTAPEVAIIGKDHIDGETFAVFAHVNIEGATKYGVVFSSKTGYTLNNNFGVEDATPQNENRYKKVSIDVTDEGADYMAVLNYKDGATPTRYARAFVFANGQYYYSKVICNK